MFFPVRYSQDPIRKEVPGAIETCHRAGVNVVMCTGDNITTACAIAKECGILPHNDPTFTAMTGKEFRDKCVDDNEQIIQAEFDKIWPTLRVLARCSPTDKFNLVSGLQNSRLFEAMRSDPSSLAAPIFTDRQVIAVTGDGTNDAPALSRADVGFAMGQNGTAVARLACDIVLLRDNFASIVVVRGVGVVGMCVRVLALLTALLSLGLVCFRPANLGATCSTPCASSCSFSSP